MSANKHRDAHRVPGQARVVAVTVVVAVAIPLCSWHGQRVAGPGWAEVPGDCVTQPLPPHPPPHVPHPVTSPSTALTVQGRKRLSLPPAGSGGFRARPPHSSLLRSARLCPCPVAPQLHQSPRYTSAPLPHSAL